MFLQAIGVLKKLKEMFHNQDSGLTKEEIEEVVGAALGARAWADSATKGKSRVADRRRSFKKKFEPTFFAMIDKSWQLFSARDFARVRRASRQDNQTFFTR